MLSHTVGRRFCRGSVWRTLSVRIHQGKVYLIPTRYIGCPITSLLPRTEGTSPVCSVTLK